MSKVWAPFACSDRSECLFYGLLKGEECHTEKGPAGKRYTPDFWNAIPTFWTTKPRKIALMHHFAVHPGCGGASGANGGEGTLMHKKKNGLARDLNLSRLEAVSSHRGRSLSALGCAQLGLGVAPEKNPGKISPAY